jgi:hypothetical protein
LYLSGVQANIEAVKGTHLRGSSWALAEDDDGDALRATMAARRLYDRELLKKLPHNRRVTVTGYERKLLFWRKATGAVTVSVLTPVETLLDGGSPAPVDVNELTEHLRRVAPPGKLRRVVGVCATSGFTEAARNARLDLPNVTVVLAEPAQHGGWRVTAGDECPDFVQRLFDPEDVEQKIERVRAEVARRGSELITGGLSAERIAEAVRLPRELVERALAAIVKTEPELKLSRGKDDTLLYRGAAAMAKERRPMNFVDRIREMFAREGNEASKINVLSERRAALAQRRDRLYEEIGQLEERESELLKQGRENRSTVVRRRLAAQVAQLRKDIGRQNTSAKMLNQQINIISTDIHNLTLIQQGQAASLPDTEELTQNAVRAEEMLETLRADADLVAGLETGVGEMLSSSEETDILAEFDAPPAGATGTAAARPAAARGKQPAAPEDDVFAEFDEPQPGPKSAARKKADPEAS